MQDKLAGVQPRRYIRSRRSARLKSTLRRRRAVNLKATRGVVQVEQHPTTRLGDHAQRLIQNLAAATVGGKDIARRATGVNANKHGLLAGWPQLLMGRHTIFRLTGGGAGVEGWAIGA